MDDKLKLRLNELIEECAQLKDQISMLVAACNTSIEESECAEWSNAVDTLKRAIASLQKSVID